MNIGLVNNKMSKFYYCMFILNLLVLSMDFGSAISICFKKYFDFSGRASRSEFWYFVLFVTLLLFGAGILLGIFMPNNQSLDGVVTLFIYLPLIIPFIAVTARRLHDFGMSGWMQCIFIPGYVAAEMMGMNAPDGLFGLGLQLYLLFFYLKKQIRKKINLEQFPKNKYGKLIKLRR